MLTRCWSFDVAIRKYFFVQFFTIFLVSSKPLVRFISNIWQKRTKLNNLKYLLTY